MKQALTELHRDIAMAEELMTAGTPYTRDVVPALIITTEEWHGKAQTPQQLQHLLESTPIVLIRPHRHSATLHEHRSEKWSIPNGKAYSFVREFIKTMKD